MSEPLLSYAEATSTCTRCPLAATRTQVVFGSGDPNAELMFVGEAPGFHEDKQGVPFVGQAGKLLETLLNGIGLSRADVYIANVLKCRPPGNRDPQPEEIEACESHLFHQIELIRPTLVATLGNFATKLLSGKPTGITRVHGVPQQVTLGGNEVTLYPLYHPAAALYTRSMLAVLEEDFPRIPELLGLTTVVPEPVERRARAGARARAVARAGRPARPLLGPWRCVELPRGDGGDRRAAGARARAGDVVTVSGELGSGKTTFVRGACRALGVTAPVTSPTYTIGHRYEGEPDVSHLDLYRFTAVSAGRVGRPRAVLRRRDRLRRVAGGGRSRPAAGAGGRAARARRRAEPANRDRGRRNLR